MTDKEDIEDSRVKVERLLYKCTKISRPYDYEHNHFLLVEALAEYVLDTTLDTTLEEK